MTVANVILVITVILTALQAGLFYAWSCSVMPGFASLSDREFVSVMQKTNRAIQNPVFFAAFFGAPIFLVISTVLRYNQSPNFLLLLASTFIYLIGNFSVTVFGNVPMNSVLDRFDLESADNEQITRQRVNFERRWTILNHVRAISSTISLILVLIACLHQ